jgi:hypothetical protein
MTLAYGGAKFLAPPMVHRYEFDSSIHVKPEIITPCNMNVDEPWRWDTTIFYYLEFQIYGGQHVYVSISLDICFCQSTSNSSPKKKRSVLAKRNNLFHSSPLYKAWARSRTRPTDSDFLRKTHRGIRSREHDPTLPLSLNDCASTSYVGGIELEPLPMSRKESAGHAFDWSILKGRSAD